MNQFAKVAAPAVWFVKKENHNDEHYHVIARRVFILYGVVAVVFFLTFINTLGKKVNHTEIGDFVDIDHSIALSGVTLAGEEEIYEEEEGLCGELEVFTELEGSAYFQVKQECKDYFVEFFADESSVKTEDEGDELAFVVKHDKDNVQHKFYMVQPTSGGTDTCNPDLYGDNLVLREELILGSMGVYDVTGVDGVLCVGSSGEAKFCASTAGVEEYIAHVGDVEYHTVLGTTACDTAMARSLYITITNERPPLMSVFGIGFSLAMFFTGTLTRFLPFVPGFHLDYDAITTTSSRIARKKNSTKSASVDPV